MSGTERLPATPPPYTWPSVGYGTLKFRRILVVQTQRLGDVLCATPMLTALRTQFPAAKITALVHRPHEQILVGNTDIDSVVTYDRHGAQKSLLSRLRFIDDLRSYDFHWALVIHAASSVGFALWQSGIPWRTCVWRYGDRRKPHWARMYHQHIRQDRVSGECHEAEHNLNVLRELGIEPRHQGYRVCLMRQERDEAQRILAEGGRDAARPLAVLHPGHGGGRQGWPPERYARVGDALARRGYQVAVTGGAAEAELVAAVRSPMTEPSIPLAGGMPLRVFAGVLAEASLLVSVPTGPMHLASALGVPTVNLYGPTDLHIDQTRFYPYGGATRPPYRAVVSTVPCVCKSSHTCADPVCMTGITPEMVLEAADAVAGC